MRKFIASLAVLLLLLTERDGMEEGWQRALVSLPLLIRTLI